MQFVSLQYLWLFWLIPLGIFFYFILEKKRRKKTKQIIAKELWPQMIPYFSPLRRYFKEALILVSLIFLLSSLLRPQWGYELREIKRRGVDIFVLVDTSDSMLAQDMKPNRMERAKRELVDLVSYLQGDRVGLIAYAGKSYVACPLTTDYETFSLFIDNLDTDLIPVQGTDISGAVSKALESFSTDQGRSKAIILITDGEDTTGGMVQAGENAKKEEVKIFVVGIGNENGAPIPLKEGNGFKKDASGQVVMSHLEEKELQQLALTTGGSYVRSVTGDLDLEQIYLKGIKEVLKAQELKTEKQTIGKERFQIPLLIALLLLIFETLVSETDQFIKVRRKH